jgi:hypothetical protein
VEGRALGGGFRHEQGGWHLTGSRSGRGLVGLSSWFGRLGAFGFDAGMHRALAVGVYVVMVLGRVWGSGNGPRLHS